jgi:hypothetical protein
MSQNFKFHSAACTSLYPIHICHLHIYSLDYKGGYVEVFHIREGSVVLFVDIYDSHCNFYILHSLGATWEIPSLIGGEPAHVIYILFNCVTYRMLYQVLLMTSVSFRLV